MVRYFCVVLCMVLGICSSASATWISNANEITEEWLIKEGAKNGFTDHIVHFKRLFSKVKVRTFLEFGVGFSTKYFIDKCQRVVSVEFVTPDASPKWLRYCLKLYCRSKTWLGLPYFSAYHESKRWAKHKYKGADSVHKASSYQHIYRKSYASIDASFLEDLNTCIKQQVTGKDVDVAFVDCLAGIRGDLVQLLFDKVPIIVAHDMPSKEHREPDNVYGYGRIIVPANYVEIHIPAGCGTVFWVKNENAYREIICDLQAYAASY